MNWKLDLLSPVSLSAVFVLVGVLALGLFIARFATGPPADIARRSGLLVIRGVVVLLLLLLLFNPVQVSESPGKIERADVFYLMDASESMKMGGDEGTRWDHAVEIIHDAQEKSRDKIAADVKLFRFGNRLASVEERGQGSEVRSQEDEKADSLAAVTPTDTDTRLQMALRQVTSRFGRSPPAALVVFSDGRARDTEGIEELARHFAELNVPIHVVPVGDTAKGSDVAIVAAVVPESVRRHSRVEVQVFLRSYGFDERRVELHLSAIDDDGTPLRSLIEPQPITLHSGFQSYSLSFRADRDTRRLLIHIPPESDEVSSQNNSIEAETYIDQTKIRVLYVEGTRQLPQSVRQGDAIVTRGPYSELQQALTADDDIECVVVSGAYGDLRRMAYGGGFDATRGFPQTSAELSAFDAVILSNVSRNLFTDEQIQWIDRWVSERGAGLCMLGGPESFASGGWAGDTIEKILPVVMNGNQLDWDPGAVVQGKVDMPPTLHPIWHLVSNANQNRAIVESFPVFDGLNRGLRVKEALATALVTAPVGRSTRSQPTARSRLLGLFLGSQQQAPRADSATDAAADRAATAGEDLPVITVGRYGKGRSMAMATAITEPWARAFLNDWGEGDSRYYAKFWRNVIYWLTEDSTIGRRRLIASHDKQYYNPGDEVSLRAIAYDEGANTTQAYRVVAMIEPKSALLDPDDFYSPVRWPNGVPREEGMEGPLVMWGEEFELPKSSADTAGSLGGNLTGYGIELKLNDVLLSGAANEGLRIELTAMEDQTQVDSTSLEIHILHDPFEQQNPFPDHELLKEVARVSGGQVLESSDDLAAMITNVDVKQGPPVVRKSPLWSNWWMWSVIVGLLTTEWLWRRSVGLA
ncbi:MAG: glutamine amidotransferase [Planctomycetota bacterium]|nr:glutamine amidotransferase [Planctomycetota bacterium]